MGEYIQSAVSAARGHHSVVSFSHIHNKLSQSEVSQLKTWYCYYHRLSKLYEWSYRSARRKRIALDLGSLRMVAVGTIAGAVTMNVVVLAVVSGVGLIVNGSSKMLNLKEKESANESAYRIYSELLVRIRSYLRGVSYSQEVLVSDMALLDEMVSRDAPCVEQRQKVHYERVYAAGDDAGVASASP